MNRAWVETQSLLEQNLLQLSAPQERLEACVTNCIMNLHALRLRVLVDTIYSLHPVRLKAMWPQAQLHP